MWLEGTNKIQTFGKRPSMHCQGPLDSQHLNVRPHQEATFVGGLDSEPASGGNEMSQTRALELESDTELKAQLHHSLAV